jgi:ABC-type polysaccharide/polyol phosphate export permease
MFQSSSRRNKGTSALAMGEVIFHLAVRNVRKSHGNAVRGLLMTVLQSIIMVLIMYFMFDLFGMRRLAISGADFMLFVMSGVLPFMLHTSVITSVASAESATSSMMNHSPMNTLVAIAGAALATLYKQFLSIFVILFTYHCAFHPVVIDEPGGFLMMLLLSWACGIGIGMIFRAAMPWHRDFFGILRNIYTRMNMLFSGKMMVASVMSGGMIWMFYWNPLFHVIDQTRGFMFLNYTPRITNITYPVCMAAILMVIGLMGEHFTSKRMSRSWSARD